MALDVVTVGVVCADVMVRPVDSFPERGKLTLVPQLEIHLGGLASVTAAVLSQLGGQAGVIGRLGADGFGDYISGALAKSGVDVSRLKRDAAEGTSATVVLIGEDGERTFLHRVGATAAISEADVDLDYVKSAKVFHWGGPAITPGLDGPPMGRVMERVRALGVKTSMDTVYDGTGVWFPLIEAALPHVDIVMTNHEEGSRYTGKDSCEDIAGVFLSHGAEAVMVKLGHEGLYVQNRETAHQLPAHTVTAVDTTGAGDAACAGFLYGYTQGWDLLACGQLANAAGGLTVQSMGGAEGVQSLEACRALIG